MPINPFSCRGRRVRHGLAATLWLGAGLLGACAQQSPAGAGPTTACSLAGEKAPSSGLRMMLVFRQPVDGGAAQVLQRLQQASGHCAVFLASVSPTVHTYAFNGAADAGRLRQSLLTWSLVQDVVPDQKTAPHKMP